LPTIIFAALLGFSSAAVLAQSGGSGGGGGGSAGGWQAVARVLEQGPRGSVGAGTAAVNGIPNGPANAAGLNNSGNDPSGAGNAAKVVTPPGIQSQGPNSGTSSAATGNAGSSSGTSTRANSTVTTGSGIGGRATGKPTTTTDAHSDAAIDAENRKLDRKIKSICKGC